MTRSSILALMACAAVVTFTIVAVADGKAGTKGTCTAWEGKAVLTVESCDQKDGDWDYVACSRALHDRVPGLLCKKHGPGKYNWGFQVGDEKPPLVESVSCK